MTYNIDKIRNVPMNRFNCSHLPELMQLAKRDLQRAHGMPHATPKQAKAKTEAITEAQRVYDERAAKYNAYRKAFPEMFPNT